MSRVYRSGQFRVWVTGTYCTGTYCNSRPSVSEGPNYQYGFPYSRHYTTVWKCVYCCLCQKTATCRPICTKCLSFLVVFHFVIQFSSWLPGRCHLRNDSSVELHAKRYLFSHFVHSWIKREAGTQPMPTDSLNFTTMRVIRSCIIDVWSMTITQATRHRKNLGELVYGTDSDR